MRKKKRQPTVYNPYSKSATNKRKLSYVKQVVAGYSDCSCEGCRDVKQHWLPKIWPSVKRANLKDPFHGGLKMLSDSVRPHHELSPTFSRSLSRASLAFAPSSVTNHILTLYKSKETYEINKIDHC